MNTSTIIGLKYGGVAAAIWFAVAFVLINLGLRAEFVLLTLVEQARPHTSGLMALVF
ncbi:hypothetical protein SDC9_164521 [bioreactor metagenome]|uniref:Uncharacterized protein n=1 Tax=bioreactor metagenome TaxID=1076179 RepID=A0A645FRW5_9ZZZZ